MKYLPIENNLFVENREKLFKKLTPNSLAIFNSNDIMPTNSDGTMPFKQNSDLFWLSGIDQEDSLLVLSNFNGQNHSTLFLKETSELIAIWEGAKLSKKEALSVSGIQDVCWLNECEKKLEIMLNNSDVVYLNKNIHARCTSEVETRDDRFRKNIIKNYPESNIQEVAPIMHELRSIKSNIEVLLMKNACDITEKAFRRILSFISPGVMEYEIEAEIIHEFIKNRSRGFAYEPIIGSGKNSCILHYTSNDQKCCDGDILLMDFGAEYANYASDLTRTVPVNGQYSDRQKSVYNSVLKVMKEATTMLREGTIFKNYNDEVGKIMESELIKLKLLDRHDVAKQDRKNPLY